VKLSQKKLQNIKQACTQTDKQL